MAEQVFRVEPTRALEQMMVRVAEAAAREITKAILPSRALPRLALDQIRINAPDGPRFLFVDLTGESHWVAPGQFLKAEERGWKQAFTRSAT